MTKINHWTSEQDARQLEMWSDRHPLICGAITLCTLPFYAVMILGGIAVALVAAAWSGLPDWIKNVAKFVALASVTLFGFYWLVYAGLWTCGKVFGADH